MAPLVRGAGKTKFWLRGSKISCNEKATVNGHSRSISWRSKKQFQNDKAILSDLSLVITTTLQSPCGASLPYKGGHDLVISFIAVHWQKLSFTNNFLLKNTSKSLRRAWRLCQCLRQKVYTTRGVAPQGMGAGKTKFWLRGNKFSCNKSLRKQTNQVNNIKS